MRRWAVPLVVLGLSHAAGAADLDYLRGSTGYAPGYQVIQTPAQELNAAGVGSVAPLSPVRSCWINDITRANQQVSVDFIDTQVWYGPEIINPAPQGFGPAGVPLDGEKGWVPGLRATGAYMEEIGPICNLYVSGSFSWINGHTNYWASAGPALSNVDGATVENSDVRLGIGFNVGPNGMITPYLGGGSRWWDRLLSGPFGYNEVYKHDYAGVGLLVQYSPAPRWVLSANGLVGGTFDASQVSSLTPEGATTVCVCTFPLGSSTIYKAGGSVDYAMTEHLHANAGIDYTYFKYGQSPVVVSGPFAFLEPNSKTSDTTLSVGLGYHW
jgi:hypothetical protein